MYHALMTFSSILRKGNSSTIKFVKLDSLMQIQCVLVIMSEAIFNLVNLETALHLLHKLNLREKLACSQATGRIKGFTVWEIISKRHKGQGNDLYSYNWRISGEKKNLQEELLEA